MAAIPLSGQAGGIQPGVSALQTTIGYTPPPSLDVAIDPVAFGTTMLAWFNTLPTTLPASPGVLWNNGGMLALS